MSKLARLRAENEELLDMLRREVANAEELLRACELWKHTYMMACATRDGMLDRWHWQVMARSES